MNIPKIYKWILSGLSKKNNIDEVLGDFEEQYCSVISEKGRFYGFFWLIFQLCISIPRYLKINLTWSMIMIRNYIKIAYRNFFRQRLFSFINIFGLAIGIASCMIISFWVQRELSYDRFHTKADRIYRLERELFRDNNYSKWPIVNARYRQALIDDYPEIEDAVRFWRIREPVADHRNVVHTQQMIATDNSIFNMFDFKLLSGNRNNALKEPMSVVLTPEEAVKYTGTTDAVGKTIAVEWEDEMVDFKVTGIIDDVPVNSHFHFTMLISMPTIPDTVFGNWRSNYLYTYLLLKKGTSKKALEDKFPGFIDKYLAANYKDLTVGDANIHDVLKMELFPLTDIHLNPKTNWEIEPQGNRQSVYVFSSIAALILIIACINFMNLSTARANSRAKEVSMRKAVGAKNSDLQLQFMGESMFLAIVALFLSLIIIAGFIPLFNSVFNESFSFSMLTEMGNLLVFGGVTLFAGIFSGLYPAFYLTRFEPAEIVKGQNPKGIGKSSFRRNMVVIQFVISVFLIIGTMTVYKQLNYIQSRSLGYDRENIVVIPARNSQASRNFPAFRNELLQSPFVQSVAASTTIPSNTIYGNSNFYSPEKDVHFSLYIMSVDFGFIETYRMEMAAGRPFSRDFSTDTTGTLILNEAAVKKYGWSPEEAVGKRIDYYRGESSQIVGVVKDFSFRSSYNEIEPLAIILVPDYFTNISVRLNPGDVEESIGLIRQKWQKIFPGEEFSFSFLEDRLNRLYANEMKLKNIFIMFTCFSIFVGCLGLFGLTAYIAEERTKEIGIRKILGSSQLGIIGLLSRNLLFLVMAANCIAWPIAWFLIRKWLQNFAFQVSVGLEYFLMAGILSVLIALITVSFQTIKSARKNPADSLKHQ